MMQVCGLFCTGPAEPMVGHDEAPFLNGRGLRAGPSEPVTYPALLASGSVPAREDLRVRREAFLTWVSMTSCSTSEVA